MTDEAARLLRAIRTWLALFIGALVLSGLTAFPLQSELALLVKWTGADAIEPVAGSMNWWLRMVRDGLADSYAKYPWLGYGTDWLAFAHLAIAVFFLGPLRDPVRNVWIVKSGLVACAGVVVLALICGPIRGIPVYWRLIDCSFGVIGALPLWQVLRLTRRLEACSGR